MNIAGKYSNTKHQGKLPHPNCKAGAPGIYRRAIMLPMECDSVVPDGTSWASSVFPTHQPGISWCIDSFACHLTFLVPSPALSHNRWTAR